MTAGNDELQENPTPVQVINLNRFDDQKQTTRALSYIRKIHGKFQPYVHRKLVDLSALEIDSPIPWLSFQTSQ
jgi:hypothetical protein